MAKNTRKEIDEANAIEWRLFCHSYRLRGYTFQEIAAEASRKFQRPFTVAKVAKLAAIELDERLALDDHVVSRLRYAEVEKLDGLQLVAETLLAPTYLDDLGVVKRRSDNARLSGVHAYLAIHDRRAKLLGLNAAEKIEATVTVVTPQDPAVQALIQEAERALTEGATQ